MKRIVVSWVLWGLLVLPAWAQFCTGRQVISASRGIVEDGSGPFDYTNGTDCEWLLLAPNGFRAPIRLEFDLFGTEAETDVVEVYAGGSRSAPRVLRLSGRELPDIQEVVGDSVLIHFRSDSSGTGPGWRFNFRWLDPLPTCVGSWRLDAPEASFGTNGPYAGACDCEWIIDVPQAKFLVFETRDLPIFGSRPEIYDGLQADATAIAYNLHQEPRPQLLYTSGPQARVRFTNESPSWGAGWTLHYRALDERPVCSGSQDQGDSWQGVIEVQPTANQRTDSLDCEWVLEYPSVYRGRLRLSFEALQTAQGIDFVEVFEGYDSRPTYRFSGTDLPAVLEWETRVVRIGFRNRQPASWRLRYTWLERQPTCQGRQVLTEPSGRFSDGSQPFDLYTNNLDCEWLVAPEGAARIFLSFEYLSLGMGDRLDVYAGDSIRPDRLVSRNTNTYEVPAPQWVEAEQALVHFVTDGASFNEGWVLNYTSQPSGRPASLRPTAALALYPNPTSGPLDLRFELPAGERELTLRLYDAQGRLAWSEHRTGLAAGPQHWQLSLPTGLAAGIYLLRLTLPDGTEYREKWVRNY